MRDRLDLRSVMTVRRSSWWQYMLTQAWRRQRCNNGEMSTFSCCLRRQFLFLWRSIIFGRRKSNQALERGSKSICEMVLKWTPVALVLLVSVRTMEADGKLLPGFLRPSRRPEKTEWSWPYQGANFKFGRSGWCHNWELLTSSAWVILVTMTLCVMGDVSQLFGSAIKIPLTRALTFGC